jgi:hypothetical protein
MIMKEPAFNDKVIRKLNEFEAIQDIQPSAGWNDLLMKKIESAKPVHVSTMPSAGYVISVLFIVLLNLGFVLSSILNKSNTQSSKDTEMQVISQEFLINPISIKY